MTINKLLPSSNCYWRHKFFLQLWYNSVIAWHVKHDKNHFFNFFFAKKHLSILRQKRRNLWLFNTVTQIKKDLKRFRFLFFCLFTVCIRFYWEDWLVNLIFYKLITQMPFCIWLSPNKNSRILGCGPVLLILVRFILFLISMSIFARGLKSGKSEDLYF